MYLFNRSNILTSLVLFSLTQLIGCGAGDGDGDGDGDSEIVPTSSVLVTSRSPDHNDINVSTSTDITITGDPSIINEDLYIVIYDVGQNENCSITWEGVISCPATNAGRDQLANNIQGNTAVFEWGLGLDASTNYLVSISNEVTSSPDDDFRIYWTFRTFNRGVFLDSPVISIGYRTETLEGFTGFQGEYDYLTGETVTFFIGDLIFPTIAAKGTVTPLDLAGTTDINNPKVVNMIRLLQTLDYDGNPDNGISITGYASNNATQVDFSLSVADFESSIAVTELISNAQQIDPVTQQPANISNLVSTTSAISHFQGQLDALEKLKFHTDTLPGTYNVAAPGEGNHSYTFKDDGSVVIVFPDDVLDVGNTLVASWSVNNDGQLKFSGPISDTFTLTSGDQSSGTLDIVFDDVTGVSFATGTIELVPGTAFDGSYNITSTATTVLGANGFSCANFNSFGAINISNSKFTNNVTDNLGNTASFSGDVQSDGSVSGSIVLPDFFSSYQGIISGTSGSGTWQNSFLCEGNWQATKI